MNQLDFLVWEAITITFNYSSPTTPLAAGTRHSSLIGCLPGETSLHRMHHTSVKTSNFRESVVREKINYSSVLGTFAIIFFGETEEDTTFLPI